VRTNGKTDLRKRELLVAVPSAKGAKYWICTTEQQAQDLMNWLKHSLGIVDATVTTMERKYDL
jgi:hypothetical protein